MGNVKRRISICGLMMILTLLFNICVQAKTISKGSLDGTITYGEQKLDDKAKIYLFSNDLKKKNLKNIKISELVNGKIDKSLSNKIYFIQANNKGKFTMKNLAKGKYRIVIISNNAINDSKIEDKDIFNYQVFMDFFNNKQLSYFVKNSKMDTNKTMITNINIKANHKSNIECNF